MFFSRWSASKSYDRKRLNSAMVSENIKECSRRSGELAEGVKKFSNKSYKIGGISSLKALGIAQSIIMTKMDHRTAAASRAYQRPTLGVNQGPLARRMAGFQARSSNLGEMLNRA